MRHLVHLIGWCSTILVMGYIASVALPLPPINLNFCAIVNVSRSAQPLEVQTSISFLAGVAALSSLFILRFAEALRWRCFWLMGTFLFWASRVSDATSLVAFSPFVAGVITSLLPLKSQRQAVDRVIIVVLVLNVTTGIICYVIGYRQYFTPMFGARASGLFGSPNTFYPIALLSLIVMGERMRRAGMFESVCFILSFLVLALTFTRAAALGTASYFALRSFDRSATTTVRSGLAAISGLVVLGSFLVRSGFVLSVDRSGMSRFRIWGIALQCVRDAPLFGHGLSSFDLFGPHWTEGVLPHEPKNIIFALLLDGGVVGLFLTATSCFALMSDKWPTTGVRGMPGPAIVAFAIAGLADTPIFGDVFRLPATLLFLVNIGIILGDAVSSNE